MPRTGRNYLGKPGLIVHAYNWGVKQEEIFRCTRDYDQFMDDLFDAQQKIPVSVLVHTLIPRRFDLLLLQHEPFAVSSFIKRVCQPFAVMMNKRLHRCGPFFCGRFKSEVVEHAPGLLRLSRLIHRGPVDEGLVAGAEEWRNSSCRTYIEGSHPRLENPSLILALVGGPDQYARFLRECNSPDPVAVEEYLCSDFSAIWEERGAMTILSRESEG